MAAEEPKNQLSADNSNGESEIQRRERSKIAFPYGDLDDAVKVAKAVGEHGGLATMDQLARALEHDTVESGTFKMKLATARVFGLVEIKGERVSLTDLGNQITRTDSEPHARAQAFLHVPLFREIYDKYKGRLLPGDAALEANMLELGVATKQTSRARQAFQRSAAQAKLGRDRLVLPGGVSLDSKPTNGEAGRKMEHPQQFTPAADLNPMIAVLLKSLPPTGSEWPRDARDQWMRIFEITLDNLYKDKE